MKEPSSDSKTIRSENKLQFRLRDRDTGELVYTGIMDVNGQVELTEVGAGYIELLKQIGVSIGDA